PPHESRRPVTALAKAVILFIASAKGGKTSAKDDKTSAKGGEKTAAIADFQGAAPILEFTPRELLLFMRKEAKRGTMGNCLSLETQIKMAILSADLSLASHSCYETILNGGWLHHRQWWRFVR